MAAKGGIKWIWGPARALFRKMPEGRVIIGLSLLTGILCGLAAVLLKLSIHWIQDGLSTLFAARGWVFLILPGVGMLISLLLVKFIVRDDIGHGVTKVLQAVSVNESRIKRRNTWSSLLTSAVTIGFGGSVGAEAPIVFTGAAIGSNLGRYSGLSYRGMTLLLGCGAAGAVAGIFNAPLAGVLFTLEILLFNLSMSGVLPLLVSSVSATIVSYLCLGHNSLFDFELAPFYFRDLPLYLVLGLFCAFSSLYFTRTTLWLEDRLGKIKSTYWKWLLCAVSLCLLIYLLPPLRGEGYGFLSGTMSGKAISVFDSPWILPVYFLAVILLKVFSMTFTNSGGGVGGTFGPTLFVGGMGGCFIATVINLTAGQDMAAVSNFAMAGMAGLMAGVMQAPLTAIFLIAEISNGYELLVPIIFTAAVSYGCTRIFEKYSIYTKRIAARGELLTHDSDQAVLTLLHASSLVETDFLPVRIDATLGDLVECVSRSDRNIFPVLDSRGRFQGYVTLARIRRDMFHPESYDSKHVYNYMETAPEYVYPGEPMDSVMRKFEKTGAWNLPMVDEDRKYLGFLSKSKIFNAYRQELRDFSQD